MTDRYSRQIALAEIGPPGQARLAAASVLVVGAGGLGSAVLQALAGAGVGRIVIVDHDRVAQSNLHRQPLYAMADIGGLKAEAARAKLLSQNPEIDVVAVTDRLTPQNAQALAAGVTLVVDAADSFAVSYVLSDLCHDLGLPLVSASVTGMAGYAGAFCGGAPSYRAVFPQVSAQAGNCDTIGVLGSAVAIIGAIQAQLCLSLILGLEPPVLGTLFTCDAKRLTFGKIDFSTAPESPSFAPFIAATEIAANDFVVDLRGRNETSRYGHAGAHRLGENGLELEQLPLTGQRLVLCCRSGQRALTAANRLQELGHKNLALVAFGD